MYKTWKHSTWHIDHVSTVFNSVMIYIIWKYGAHEYIRVLSSEADVNEQHPAWNRNSNIFLKNFHQPPPQKQVVQWILNWIASTTNKYFHYYLSCYIGFFRVRHQNNTIHSYGNTNSGRLEQELFRRQGNISDQESFRRPKVISNKLLNKITCRKMTKITQNKMKAWFVSPQCEERTHASRPYLSFQVFDLFFQFGHASFFSVPRCLGCDSIF